MSETCVVCSSRRAQRECPAVPGQICSQCCGRGRRRTIDCPDSCKHYLAGVRKAVSKLAALGGNIEFDESMADVMHNLRHAIIHVREARLPDMTDEEAKAAVANAGETMRVRSKGLVYDFRSPDPRVQLVADELVAVATGHERGEKGLRRATSAELVTCLKHIEHQVERLAAGRTPTAAFLDLAAQSVGRRQIAADGRWVGQP